jgi:peptide/nickel transport system substrate-binding protein
MRSKLFILMSLAIIATMLLAACGPTPTPVIEKVIETIVVEKEGQTIVVTATPEPVQAVEFKSKDPTTYVYANIGTPDTLDPAYDYESAGQEVLANVYDTLWYYKKESPVEYVPMVAVEVPSLANGGISTDGLTFTVKIRPSIKFHDGTDLTAEDVAYSFRRGLLQGGGNSPQWLFTEPLLGAGVYDVAELVDSSGALNDDPEGLAAADPALLKAACEKILSVVVPDNAAGTVTFTLAQSWGPFLATFTGGWGAIQSKAWASANGAWDGSCDTWQTFYGKGPEQLNALPIGSSAMGSGPYKLDHWTPGEELVLKANENYWRTEAAWEGGPTGAPALKTVVYRTVEEFNTRLAMLQAGDADAIDLGSSENWPIMDQLVGEFCDNQTKECKPGDKPDQFLRRVTNFTTGTRTDVFFNFKVNDKGGNNFVGSGTFDGNGVPVNFFSDAHIRKAFNYCFDFETYKTDVLQGEAVRSRTVMLPGMLGYDETAPIYEYDLVKCEEEFKASMWNEVEVTLEDGTKVKEWQPDPAGTVSVWDVGFRLTMGFNSGNTQRQTIAEILQAGLSTVNEKFILEATALPWPAYLSNISAKKLPIFTIGWIMDMYETHNWTVPYTSGYYGGRQNLPADIKAKYNDINTRAVMEVDPAKRDAIYKTEFNPLFYETCQGLLLFQVNGRHYEPRYSQGWFFNPIYAGDYYYALSKK